MRIVDRKTFLTLPEGTIYAKGEQWYFGSLHIKFETMRKFLSEDYTNDWYALDPCWIDADSSESFDILDKMLAEGISYPMINAITRDGLYEKDALFLIFEKDDLVRLREYIDEAIKKAGELIHQPKS